MKIDVVIPLCNGARWIQETLTSVLGQTIKPNKIIVVDDGSTDGSPELVLDFSGVILLRNPKKGSSSARNFGLQHADAPLIAFLDHDDIWHKEHLQRLSEVFISNPEIDMTVSQCTIFNDGTPHHFDVSKRSFELINPWDIYPVGGYPTSCSMVRRNALFEVGGWPAGVSGCNDYVLAMKMSAKKPIARLCAKTVAYRKSIGSQLWNLNRNNPRRNLALLEKEADTLMDYFTKSSSDPAANEKIRVQNQIAHSVNNLILALIENKDDVLKDSILKIEQAKVIKNSYYMKRIFAHLIYVLADCFALGTNSAEIRSFCLKLFENWPKEAPLTREVFSNVVIEERLGIGFYKEYFLRLPWNFEKLNFLSSAMINKFSNLTGRCHEA